MESKLFSVFSYNGKDLFLQAADESFVVLSFCEIPHDVREQLCHDRDNGVVGRQIKLSERDVQSVPTADEVKAESARIIAHRKMELIRTAKENEETRLRKARHGNLLRDVAAYESSGELSPSAQAKLTQLREELAEHEPADPTAVTLAAKRSNASCE
jgi:hypothetical protein